MNCANTLLYAPIKSGPTCICLPDCICTLPAIPTPPATTNAPSVYVVLAVAEFAYNTPLTDNAVNVPTEVILACAAVVNVPPIPVELKEATLVLLIATLTKLVVTCTLLLPELILDASRPPKVPLPVTEIVPVVVILPVAASIVNGPTVKPL